jgi:DNA-directed RNA polymerase specialized sigma24 family protein
VKPAAPHLLSEADWAQARAFLHGRLRRLLDRCDEAVVEDATQEAAVRLLRVMRREEVRNLEALMNDICRKTAIDIMRSNGRFRATFEPLDEQAEHVAIESTADPLERLEFAVLEFFRGRQAACYDLAVAYFNDRDWEQVADTVGKSHAAVRKQWSRCLGLLRSVARRSSDPLFSWARG